MPEISFTTETEEPAAKPVFDFQPETAVAPKFDFQPEASSAPTTEAEPAPQGETTGDFLRRIPATAAEASLHSAAGLARLSTDPGIGGLLVKGSLFGMLPDATKKATADFLAQAADSSAESFGVNAAADKSVGARVAGVLGGLWSAIPMIASGGTLGLAGFAGQMLGSAKESDYQGEIAQGKTEEQAHEDSTKSALIKTGVTLPLFMAAGTAAGKLADSIGAAGPAQRAAVRFVANLVGNSVASSTSRGVEAAVDGKPVLPAMGNITLEGLANDTAFSLMGTAEGFNHDSAVINEARAVVDGTSKSEAYQKIIKAAQTTKDPTELANVADSMNVLVGSAHDVLQKYGQPDADPAQAERYRAIQQKHDDAVDLWGQSAKAAQTGLTESAAELQKQGDQLHQEALTELRTPAAQAMGLNPEASVHDTGTPHGDVFEGVQPKPSTTAETAAPAESSTPEPAPVEGVTFQGEGMGLLAFKDEQTNGNFSIKREDLPSDPAEQAKLIEQKRDEMRKAFAEPDATPEQIDQMLRDASPRTETQVTGLPITEAPINQLKLSQDVPQFKGGANDEGMVAPLAGKFDRTGVGPIQVWRRTNGDLEVISGRHRLDLARRSGEATIPAQIHDESAGFDQRSAARLDAELNIRDEQGSTADYASYFRHSDLSEADAIARGLLARPKGKEGWAIARDASADVFALHQSGRLPDNAAASIVEAAPGDQRLQAVGVRAINEGRSGEYAANLIKFTAGQLEARRATGEKIDEDADLFGHDDSALKEAEAGAQKVTQIQRDLREQINAVKGAARKPELAANLGVNVKDPKGVQKRIKQLQAEIAQWDGEWFLHPELMKKLRGEEPAKVEQAAPKEEPKAPKLRAGEKQGDLLSTHSEPLKLVGEEAPDLEKIAREKAQAEADATESKAAAERDHMALFEPKPESPSQPPAESSSAPAPTEAVAKPAALPMEEVMKQKGRALYEKQVREKKLSAPKFETDLTYRVITPDTSGQGWRVTSLEKEDLTPVGHTEHPDLESAIAAASDGSTPYQGKIEPVPGNNAKHGAIGSNPAPDALKQIRAAKPSSDEVLNSSERVTVTAPEGATVLRVTPKKGNPVVESIKNVDSGGKVTGKKGVNVLKDVGPFTKIEAGTMGGKGGKEFIPIKGEVKVEPTTEGERFMSATPERVGVSVEKGQRHFEEVTRRIDQLKARVQGVDIEVLRNESELPSDARSQIKPGVIHEGLADTKTGKVWLFSDNISNAQRAAEVFAHEVIGHVGVNRIVDAKEWKAIGDTILKNHPEEVADLARRYFSDEVPYDSTNQKHRDLLAKEFVARLAEKPSIAPTLWKRVVLAVQRALRALGIRREWSDAEIRDLIHQSANRIERPTKGGSDSGGIMASIIAHHGTPHEVDRFSSDKIGTGEGAQAFGYGLYFAENPKVADEYRDALSRGDTYEVNGRKLDLRRSEWSDKDKAALALFDKDGDRRAAINWLKSQAKFKSDPYSQLAQIKILESESLKPAKKVENAGQTYTVHLDVEPDDLMDWDKPFSEQSEKVKAALNEFWGEYQDEYKTGGDFYRANAQHPMQGGSIKETSDWLNSLGIPGIRFLDQGSRQSPFADDAKYEVSSRSDGTFDVIDNDSAETVKNFPTRDEAKAWAKSQPDPNLTHNIVIFDDSKVRITHKNGEPVSAKERAQAIDEAKGGGAENESSLMASIKAPEPEKTTSTKNEVTDYERGVRGAPEIERQATQSNTETFDRAKERLTVDPRAADKLVDALNNGTRKEVSEVDEALLLHEKVRLMNERDRAGDVIADPKASDEAKINARVEWAAAEARMNEVDQATYQSGRVWGRLGQFRQRLMRADYSFEAMQRKARVALDRPLNTDEVAKIKEQADKIAELEKRLADFENGKDQTDATGAADDKVSDLKKKAKAGKGKDVDPTALADKMRKRLREGSTMDDLRAYVQKLALHFVRSGIKEREPLIDAVHDVLKTVDPTIERRRTMDLISGYGDYKALDPEAAKATLRDIKAQAQNVAKLQDIEAKQPLQKTGVQRQEPSDLNRRLIKLVNEAKKKFGVVTTDPASQLKSSLEAIKTRLKNQLKDLATQLETGEKPPEKTQVQYDAEIERLMALRDVVKRTLAEVEGNPEMSEEDRIALAKRAAEAQISEYQRRIDESDTSPRRSPKKLSSPELDATRARLDALRNEYREMELLDADLQDAKNAARDKAQIEQTTKSISDLDRRISDGDLALRSKGQRPVSPELERLRAERTAMTQLLAKMRRESMPRRSPEERANQSLKTRMLHQQADLLDRIARKDFEKAPKAKPISLDPQNLAIKADLELTKKAFAEGVFEKKLADRSFGKKVLDSAAQTLNLTRAVLTSFDLSGVLRQGGFITLGNPLRAAKAFPGMFRAFASEHAAEQEMQALKARPQWQAYKDAKLEITENSSDHLTHMEEQYMSRWVAKIPRVLGGGFVRGSERSYRVFLNRLRADTFDSLTNALSRTGAATEEEAKAIANFVNVATGRGALEGKYRNAAAAMNTVFFAPRYVLSRFQLLGLQPLLRGSARTRVAVATEYAKFLAGAAVVYGLAQLAQSDTDPSIELDPRSADFLKVRFGDTRLDPLAGLIQTTTLMGRLISGQTKKPDGTIVPIRGDKVPYGSSNSYDIIARFLRTKFAPLPGALVNAAVGKDLSGQPVTPLNTIRNMTVPISFDDAIKAFQAQGIAKASALSILSLFGFGLQTYAAGATPEEKLRAKITNRLQKRGIDVTPEQLDYEMQATEYRKSERAARKNDER